MRSYLDIVKDVFNNGTLEPNRTGIPALTIVGSKFEHDMSTGFPLLTTKKVPFRLVASELEFFIQGYTSKRWLQDNNNHIWDEWCSPDIVKPGIDPETKFRMAQEDDLGPIYGWQWRHLGASYKASGVYEGAGHDQLKKLLETIKTDPRSRRMLVTAWNPLDIHRMALPPCHYGFQVTITSGKLNLLWNQRSVDVALGLPFNIASYALLLELLAKETGFIPGKLVGFLADVHIYENHIDGLSEQIAREPYNLPRLEIPDGSIFDWKYDTAKIIDYKSHPRIKFEVAV